ncbi:CDP-6-deoxy-delta-3,4-glucoseen reductase [Pseudomonas sp. F1_0610]|uniref:CDP-6-deoxy-delta-3,4-glucoseen reductase n=1 Tax=Pseudomonas sp. F1_0610 TaxID=3114284 RepID=UPI0039C21412
MTFDSASLAQLEPRNLFCALLDVRDLGGDVYAVQLALPECERPLFYAGQYALLSRLDGEQSAFSIANPPEELSGLEFHILAREESPIQLLQDIRQQQGVCVALPFGDVHTQSIQKDKPLLLIAASTGMSQIHSLVESLTQHHFMQPIHIYWGARFASDLYKLPAFPRWKQYDNVHMHTIISHDENWMGRSGLLYEAICADISQLEQYQVIASGSPAMVYATFDALCAAGMQPEQMQADVFAYAPRD